MSERNGSLSPDQLRAVGVLAGADPADVADCDPEAVAEWLRGDPEFIAELNRVRSYGAERLRADVRLWPPTRWRLSGGYGNDSRQNGPLAP